VAAQLQESYFPHVGWLRHAADEEIVTLMWQGRFEQLEQAALWLLLREGDLFVDCGAHIGLYSVLAAQAVGAKGRVVAIEPTESTRTYLIENLKRWIGRNATIRDDVIWDAKGFARFEVLESGRSSYSHVRFSKQDSAGVSKKTVSLDVLLRQEPRTRPIIVKLDVEGSEPEGLRGARRTIAAGRIDALMIEFTERNLNRRSWTTPKLAQLVGELGLKLAQFDGASMQFAELIVRDPIWYKNLFAFASIEEANDRLRRASFGRMRIARDLVGRSRACALHKELEDLETYRKRAEETEATRAWALRVEAEKADLAREHEGERSQWAERLNQERTVSLERKEWAERSEAGLAAARELARSYEDEKSHVIQLLDEERRLSLERKEWAERLEAGLAATKEIARNYEGEKDRLVQLLEEERRLSFERKEWAERVEAGLATTKELARNYEKEKDHVAQLLEKERHLSHERKGWAERVETSLAAAKHLAEERLTWAQSIETLLAEERSRNEVQVTGLRHEIESLSSRLEDRHGEVERFELQLSENEAVRDSLEKAITEVKEALKEERTTNASLEQKLTYAERQLSEAKVDLRRAYEVNRDAALRLTTLERQLGEKSEELRLLRVSHNHLLDFAKRLKWIYRMLNGRFPSNT